MSIEFIIDQKKKVKVVDGTKCTARIAAGHVRKNANVYGFTLGQFSISDLISELLDITGPADVTISTWTASAAKIDEAYDLFDAGKILSCRFLLDPGFRSRQPRFAAELVKKFGLSSIRTVANHAKFVVIRNSEWDVVVKTSMNLNNNPRLENFEITESVELADYIDGFVDYIFENNDPDDNFRLNAYGNLHQKTMQPTEEDILAAITAG